MAMNRDKFRNIVGGITSTEPRAQPEATAPAAQPEPPPAANDQPDDAASPPGQGREVAASRVAADPADNADHRRFAKRGRPKGSKPHSQTGNGRKVKVSLFLSETIVNDLYEWAHADRMHPGEMFEAALKPFHDREAKRRKSGKE